MGHQPRLRVSPVSKGFARVSLYLTSDNIERERQALECAGRLSVNKESGESSSDKILLPPTQQRLLKPCPNFTAHDWVAFDISV